MNTFLYALAIGNSFLALYASFLAPYQASAHEDKNVSGGDGIDRDFVRQEKKTMTDNVNREVQNYKSAATLSFLAGPGWALCGLLLSNDGTDIAFGMMFMCLGLMWLSMAKRAEKTEVGNHQEAERAYKADAGDA
jgi:hypothetical protein